MSNIKENKLNFNKTNILNLSLPEKGKIAYYYDAQVSGIGIMLFPSGTKTFFVYKRVKRMYWSGSRCALKSVV